jgi:predicted alpha/beta hydrolase family esterase
VWFPKDAQAKSHPLFLFSPGSFGVAESNETLFLELASRGYVVVSMNHPYHSFSCKMSDGRNINMDEKFIQSVMTSQGSEDLPGTLSSFKEWLKVRIDDINTVLDCISDFQNDYDYEQYIDKERVVLSGHSLGGSAVLAVGRERAQEIKALAVLEAPFAADIVGIDKDRYIFTDQPYPLPVLHVYSDALYEKMDDITTYDMNTRLMKSDNPMYVNKHIKGVGHLGLTDMRLVTPVITYLMDGGLDTRPAAETLSELNEYVLDFLNIYNN